jgi:hypothetical protein
MGCKACIAGFYSQTCETHCPVGCVDACDRSTGRCLPQTSPLSTTAVQQAGATTNLEVQTAVLITLLVVCFCGVCGALCYSIKRDADVQAKRLASMSQDQLIYLMAIRARAQQAPGRSKYERDRAEREFEQQLFRFYQANQQGVPAEPPADRHPEDVEFELKVRTTMATNESSSRETTKSGAES